MDRHADLDAAQDAQLAALDAAEEAGERLAGWKLGLTSGANRDAFGVGVRPFGYVLGSRVLSSRASLWWDDEVQAGGIENELCFVVGADVSEQVDASTVGALIAGVAPAFEINQLRLASSASPAERVADNLSNWGIVVGETQPIPTNWDQQALKVRLMHNAETVTSVAAVNHIDDHFQTLATLANRLLRFHRMLRAGDRVITGAFGRVKDPQRGLWSGDFGNFGRVHLRIER
jgi:2-keto-4-pentenoate hydratase